MCSSPNKIYRVLPRLILSFLLFIWTTYSYAQTWQALNPPQNLFNGNIFATTVDRSEHIYAGGNFKNSSNNNFVATWNGTNWIEIGSGTRRLNANGAILTLASYNDTIYAAGAFTNSLGRYYVAKWDGNSWSQLDSNASLHADEFIYAITVDKVGNVYAAGSFSNAAGKYYVAKWNGSTWGELGSGTNALNANGVIYAVTTDANNNVYAAGYFTNSNNKRYVAKWNGTSWSELGGGTNALNANDYIDCLAADANGNIYAGGNFSNSNGECYLAKWTGTNWVEVGAGVSVLHANSVIKTIAVKNEAEIYVAGMFTDFGGNYYVARYNGSTWSAVNAPLSSLQTNGDIESISIDGAGNIYAGGKFLNKASHSYIAKWGGAGWEELGAMGDPLYSSNISQVIADSAGNVYVTDRTYIQNYGDSYSIKAWNGKTWKELTLPDSLRLFVSGVHSMALDSKGKLCVTGRKMGVSYYDCVLAWDGSKWEIMEDVPNSLRADNSNPVYGINEIETDRQGNVYVSGKFMDSTYGVCSIAKWDGRKWKRLPGFANYIKEFCVAGDGNIYAYGDFSDEYGRAVIVNYNETKRIYWAEVKNGTNRFGVPGFNVFSALATDNQNNLYVNGNFTNTTGSRYIAKWDGNQWSQLGVTGSLGLNLAVDKNTTIYSNKPSSDFGDPVRKWNGTVWVALGVPLNIDPLNFPASLLAVDPIGNVYSNASLPTPGSAGYIVRYGSALLVPPKMISFTPTQGSTGTAVTIIGKNLTGTSSVSFGGTKASSFTINSDTTVTAIVGNGSTGAVKVSTNRGEDSLQTFTYTCDSVKGPIPAVSLIRDSILVSSQANYYQWFFNNNKMANANLDRITIKDAGFYHVETSAEGICWTPSLDYPVLLSIGSSPDSLQLFLYPNPSTGNFTAYARLPQAGTAMVYVQVFDISGVLVYQSSKLIFYGNEIRVPITINSKGTFFVRMTINNTTIQQSIVVM